MKALKIHGWWTSHFGTMVSFVYLVTAFSSHPPDYLSFAITFALYSIASIGIASFGYLINDLMDIRQDVQSGAPNMMASRNIYQRLLLFGLVIALGIAPWRWLPVDNVIISLLAFEYLLFALYSVPPARLKARGFLGVAADALYAYVLTCTIAILVFGKLVSYSLPTLTGVVIGSWLFVFGLEHIIRHQLADAMRDQISGINTFVVAKGWRNSFGILQEVVVPLDYAAFAVFLVVIANRAPAIPLFFGIYTVVMVRSWRRRHDISQAHPKRTLAIEDVNFLSVQLLAEFVWHWMPLLALLTLVTAHPGYLAQVVLHLVIFTRAIKSLVWRGRPAVRQILSRE